MRDFTLSGSPAKKKYDFACRANRTELFAKIVLKARLGACRADFGWVWMRFGQLVDASRPPFERSWTPLGLSLVLLGTLFGAPDAFLGGSWLLRRNIRIRNFVLCSFGVV